MMNSWMLWVAVAVVVIESACVIYLWCVVGSVIIERDALKRSNDDLTEQLDKAEDKRRDDRTRIEYKYSKEVAKVVNDFKARQEVWERTKEENFNLRAELVEEKNISERYRKICNTLSNAEIAMDVQRNKS